MNGGGGELKGGEERGAAKGGGHELWLFWFLTPLAKPDDIITWHAPKLLLPHAHTTVEIGVNIRGKGRRRIVRIFLSFVGVWKDFLDKKKTCIVGDMKYIWTLEWF